MVLWRPIRLSRTNTCPPPPPKKKKCLFHYRGLECKNRKSRDTWSNKKVFLWRTKWRTKASFVFWRERTGHRKHSLPTTQEMSLYMDITRWPTPKSDWLYSLQVKMEKVYTVSKTRPGSDCGSDHKLLIGKFKLEMKKLGKTIGPVRYELNEIPYDYTV